MIIRRTAHCGALLITAVGLLAGCDDALSGVCTSDFRYLPVTVLDSTGAPSTDASLTSVLTRTGDTLQQASFVLLVSGTYVYIDDGSRQKIQPMGDTVQVSVIPTGGTAVTVAYFITVPNGCHVTKAAGPDTIAVQ